MTQSDPNRWNNIIAEASARPLPLPDDKFREWMSRQSVFISSLMDGEMTPFRSAVRDCVRRLGATPLMWESITPQDKLAQQAYIEGVDQCTIFVLMLGRRYGVSDASGASPTHKEGIRAAEQKKQRLLFTLAGVPSSERDVKLNDWLNSLYNEVSGADFGSAETLVDKLEARLREQAARSERPWIKLGNLVFPGKVTSNLNSTGGGRFVVKARVSQGQVRHALLGVGNSFGRVRADRLTWSDHSYPVQVVSVNAESEYAGEDAVEITCETPQNWYGNSGSTLAMMNIGSSGDGDLMLLWARQAILGETVQPLTRGGAYSLGYSLSRPDAKTLPEVLAALNASGWLAEGLTRLYAVEEVRVHAGGHFHHLDVGAATANSVRVEGTFIYGSGDSRRVELQGSVPLTR